MHGHYGGRADIQGYTLQSEKVKNARDYKAISVGGSHSTFLYRVLGSWGFSPHPQVWVGSWGYFPNPQAWTDFQDWFSLTRSYKSFKPYVWEDGEELTMTKLYKKFEKQGSEANMWTMWYIYFTHRNHLYCVYNNLAKVVNVSQTCLSVHRAEPGLHYHGQPKNNQVNLLKEWKDEFVNFSAKTPAIGYDGKTIEV